MLLNYHEMTLNESSDSIHKKRQFAFICAIITAVVSYTVMTSGAMESIEPTMGIFPGGNFCHKLAHRDYAASLGLGRRISKDLLGEKASKEDKLEAEKLTYHVYLDDPNLMGGRRLRWMSGILIPDSEMSKANTLLALNKPEGKKAKGKRYPTEEELVDLTAREVLEMLPYEMTDLPSVDSLVLQFPNTHGFASALVMAYKIIPTMRKLAVEKGEKGTVPIVISTCREAEDMCTIYAPLVQSRDFLNGQLDTDAYLASMPPEKLLDPEGLKQGARKVFPYLKKYIDMLP